MATNYLAPWQPTMRQAPPVRLPTPQVRLDLTIAGPATGPNSVWQTMTIVGVGLAAVGLVGWALFR